MALTKTLKFDPEIVAIIAGMQWDQSNGHMSGKLTCGQLERKTYLAVNKALEAMGGKWNRKAQAHLFPVDPRPQVEGLLDEGTVTVEKDGYFPTPQDIGRWMARLAALKPGQLVLEPSAGTGELCESIIHVEPNCTLSVIEKNEQRVTVLQEKGYNVIGLDFFEHHGQWERIIQNPPFEEGQDIEHVHHAYLCLKPGGRLVSVMSEGSFYRSDRKAIAFRDWLSRAGGQDFDLQPGAFHASGTDVKARVIVVDKPAQQDRRLELTELITDDWSQLSLFN